MSRLLRIRPETAFKATFAWLASYKLGDPSIDDQHRRWFELTKIFLDRACRDEADFDLVRKTLEELYNYARYHFLAEEDLMRAIGYPQASLNSHMAHHDHFVEWINELAHSCCQGHPEKVQRMARFFSKWLRQHIVEIDVKYIRFQQRVCPKITTLAPRWQSWSTGPTISPCGSTN